MNSVHGLGKYSDEGVALDLCLASFLFSVRKDLVAIFLIVSPSVWSYDQVVPVSLTCQLSVAIEE